MVNIVLPMTPFLVGGFARLVALMSLAPNVFSVSELAIGLAFICLLTNQSLVKSERNLDNKDKKSENAACAKAFLALAVFVIALFAITVFLEALTSVPNYKDFEQRLLLCDFVTIIAMLIIMPASILAQMSFDLGTDLL